MIKHLLITGAGVDRSKGLDFPLAATLLPEVSQFINGAGKPVDEALRALLPNFRFRFATMIARAVDEIATRGLRHLIASHHQATEQQRLCDEQHVRLNFQSHDERRTTQIPTSNLPEPGWPHPAGCAL